MSEQKSSDWAYAHGILVGQQMAMAVLMPTIAEKAEARQRCIKLVGEADVQGLGKGLTSLDEYRVEGQGKA